jgi:hypothetical protein
MINLHEYFHRAYHGFLKLPVWDEKGDNQVWLYKPSGASRYPETKLIFCFTGFEKISGIFTSC